MMTADRGGTAAAVPPSFRFGNHALCGSHPLVTPVWTREFAVLFVSVCVYQSNEVHGLGSVSVWSGGMDIKEIG